MIAETRDLPTRYAKMVVTDDQGRYVVPDLPKGKYKILNTIAKSYTANVGYPGYSNAAVDEIFNTFLIPQMFAEVAQGKKTPAEAAQDAEKQMKTIFAKWRRRKKI